MLTFEKPITCTTYIIMSVICICMFYIVYIFLQSYICTLCIPPNKVFFLCGLFLKLIQHISQAARHQYSALT